MAKASTSEAAVYEYRLLVGLHEDNDPFYVPASPDAPQTKARIIRPGDVFKTTQRLHLLNGGGGMQPKFELLTESDPRSKKPHPFERQPGETPQQYALRLAGIANEAARIADEEGGTMPPNPGMRSPQPPGHTQPIQDPLLTAAVVDKMNEKELRAVAAEEEIELKGVNGVEAVRKAVKTALFS